MNSQKISFIVNGQTKQIEVKGVYPYQLPNSGGKVVLRMTIAEEDATYDDIYSMKNCTGVIEQYERTIAVDPETGEETAGEWVKKNTLEGYGSGEIVIGYQNGQFSADLTRVGRYEQMVEQNKADIEDAVIENDVATNEHITQIEDAIIELDEQINGGNENG
jgi:hypothetical protein